MQIGFGIKSFDWYSLTLLLKFIYRYYYIYISSGAFQLKPHSARYWYDAICEWTEPADQKKSVYGETKTRKKKTHEIRKLFDWYRSDGNVVMCKLNFMAQAHDDGGGRPASIAYIVDGRQCTKTHTDTRPVRLSSLLTQTTHRISHTALHTAYSEIERRLISFLSINRWMVYICKTPALNAQILW